MKKIFEDDSSYIEIQPLDNNPEKVVISLCARDAERKEHITMVSVEMNIAEFVKMVEESCKPKAEKTKKEVE